VTGNEGRSLGKAQIWDGRRVLGRLRAAFVACPGLAVYSRSPTHSERIAGTDDGAMLLDAVTTVLERLDRIALLERSGNPWAHHQRALRLQGLAPGRFYRRTDAAAEQVAAYLNEHAGQDVDAVQEGETAPVV
jgi:hypothetical protein